MNEEWRAKAHDIIINMVKNLTTSMGGDCDIEIDKGYPYLENDPSLTARSRAAAEAYLGKENVVDLDLTLGAEDFAYYTHAMPACFYRLGTRNEKKGITSYVHTPTFDIDEDALEVGTGMMAWLALEELQYK